MKAIVAARRFQVLRSAFLILPGLCLVGCGLGGESSYPHSRYSHQNAPLYHEPMSVFDANTSGGTAPQGATVGDNNRLWRAALETVSFMPLVSANASSGVIITDWYSAPNAPDQR